MNTASVASEKKLLLWIVVLSLAIKVALMLYIGDRAYPDVVRGAQFGRDLAQGTISIGTHLDNSKTFLGPVVFYWISSTWGLWGLRLFNLAAFAGLLVVQYRLGREWFSKWVVLAGVFVLAFYPGSHRTVSFGEPEDNLVSLLLASGILLLVRTRRPVVAGLFLGVAFLFKFWMAVFIIGFLAHFAWKRQWDKLVLAGVAAGLPFLVLNLASDWAGWRALFWSVERQQHSTSASWAVVKMMTTGLLPANVLAIWSTVRSRTEHHRLLLLLSVPYFVYVLVTADPWAATFVMVPCLVFSSFLIVDLWASFRWPLAAVVGLLALYLMCGVAIALQRLPRGTEEFVLRDEVRAPAFQRQAD